MPYGKPPVAFSGQIDILKSRGLVVKDTAFAEAFISKLNYYHFSGYCLPFEVKRHQFIEGVTFEEVAALIEFDRKLRQLFYSSLGAIEICARTQAAYYFSHAYGELGHEDPFNFRTYKEKSFSVSEFVKCPVQTIAKLFKPHGHRQWTNNLHGATIKSREIFIRHHRDNDPEKKFPKLPVWVAVEVMSFGMLSRFVDSMHIKDQKPIAANFSVPTVVLPNWLHVFCHVRNICAHHARLWDKKLSIALKIPQEDAWEKLSGKKIGTIVYAINHALSSSCTGKQCVKWREDMEALLDGHPAVPNFWANIGLSENWKDHPLWKRP